METAGQIVIQRTVNREVIQIRNIWYGIKNLINWFSTIWNDKNWDSHFIFVILRYKLYLTEQFIRKYGCHVHNERDADEIKVCINLLDRIIKDEYHENVFKDHYKKWGEPKMEFEGNVLNITHPKAITDKDKKQERKEFRRIMDKPEQMKKQDIDYLFKLMARNIQGWWD